MKNLFFSIFLLIALVFPTVSFAEDPVNPCAPNYCYCDFSPAGTPGGTEGNVTLSSSCVVYENVNGVTNGDLTIPINVAVTLHKSLVFSPGYKIDIQEEGTGLDKQRGIIYINTGGSITQRKICVKDADSDHYADTISVTTDPYGNPLTTPITQIDQQVADAETNLCASGYNLRESMNNLAMIDTDTNTDDITKIATSDREMLRLGFTIGGIRDALAAAGDIQIIDKNLLVCTGGSCPTVDFLTTTGNIYTAGKIGVGVTNPRALVDIAGNASSSGVISFRGTTDPKINVLNGESFGIQTSVGGDASLTERFTVLNNGYVGIGKTNPASALDITGDLTVSGSVNICNLVSYTSGSGTVQCPSGFYTYSGVGLTTGELLCCKVSNPI